MLHRQLVGRYTVAPEGCWEWQRCRLPQGYGRLRVSGKGVLAHRLALLGEDGLSNPLQVMHKCHNPSCINPAHLELGTGKDNMRQSQSDSRLGRSMCEAHVLDVYTALEEGATIEALAAKYGVDKSTIGHIRTGQRWAHLYHLYQGPTGSRRKLSSSQREDVVRMRKAGAVQREIAKYFNVSQTLISLILRSGVDTAS